MSESTPNVATQPGDELLLELADDYLRRYRAGEQPTEDEYVGKHPELADRIRELFPAMIVMEQPGPGATVDLSPPTERVGAIIGRYKLLERIGEGGFGVVYMAEQQQPVRRKIALKVVKPGMDSHQILARFEAERQALAIMDHPNIAKVFDAGTTESGRPYFVMELIKGDPITEFCDRNHFSPHQRLELFAQVCHAVQHAHQKGIIHRDIKPTNVLVGMHDTTPVVKVIDFGVAKALGQELTDKTLFTGFAQFLGTPLYMSPEQAGQSVLDVDTRSDIYSLGVLLYELLTGTTPFSKERFKKAAEDEIRRIIREEEPPKPSTRLSESKDSLASISAQRHTEPAKLTKMVRGELDWIVMKALEKDRSRRYETANGLARDIERYLSDEPVQACPPSVGYRFGKFARRNQGGLAVAALVLLFLVLIGSGIGWAVRDRSAREAEATRQQGERQAKAGGQVESIFAEVDRLEKEQKWADALAAARRAEAVVAGGEVDAETTERVSDRLKGLEFVDRLEQIRMMVATANTDGSFNRGAADHEYALAFREYGVDVDVLAVETSIERLGSCPALVMPVAAALDDWERCRRLSQGDRAAAKRLVAVARGIDPEPLRDRLRAIRGRPAAEVREELGRLAESISVRTEHPATIYFLSLDLVRMQRPDRAVRLLRDAQRIYPGDFWLNYNLGWLLFEQKDYEGAARFSTAAVSVRPRAAAALNYLALALANQNKPDEAIQHYHRALELDPKNTLVHNNLGSTLRKKKELDEAIRHYRKSLELDPKNADAHHGLGNILFEKKELDEAIRHYRRAIELDPRMAYAYNGLGKALFEKKELDEAIRHFHKALELNPRTANAHSSLGNALRVKKELDEAILHYRSAIELDPKMAYAHAGLGNALRDKKMLDEAIASYNKAIEFDPQYALAYNGLAWLLATCPEAKFRDAQRAVELAKRAVELKPQEGGYWKTLGVAHYRAGSWKDAVAGLEKSLELRKGGDAYDWFFLAMADWQLGDKDEALQWYTKAVAWMDKNAAANEELTRFRAEAAELLGVNEKKESEPSSAPTQ